MPTNEQLSATLEKIYAAAADPALWVDALRAIEDYTGSTGAVLNLVPNHDQAPPICLAGSFSEENCAEYAANYMWRCPRIAYGQAHPTSVHFDRMILSESEMDRDATYEWFGKHGLRYYVAGWIGHTADHGGYMSLQRSRRQGHVEPEHVEQFKLILRHMAQAMSMSIRLNMLERQDQARSLMLDTIPYALFALDGAGHLVLTNERADRMITRGDGLKVRNGRLECHLAQEQTELDRLVAASLSSDLTQPRGGWVRISRPSGRRPYVALVSLLAFDSDPTDELFAMMRPRALIAISDSGETSPSTDALQDLYGLTPTEARVAAALSSGHSIQSAAADLRMSAETLRTHLKHIFSKVGVTRQQDLIRALADIQAIPPDNA